MRSVGLIHSGAGFVARYDALIAKARPDLQCLHIVDQWLLETAQRDGLTDAVHLRVREHVRYLAGVGASAVLITCTTIGDTADSVAPRVGIAVLRVDLAVATEAAAVATSLHAFGRVAVLATTDLALAATVRMLHRAADSLGARVTVSTHLVAPGDGAVDGICRAAQESDVVILADAALCGSAPVGLRVPILTPPEGGVRTLLAGVPERRPVQGRVT